MAEEVLTPTPPETTEGDSAVLALLQEIMGVVTNLQQSVEALAPVEPAAEPEAEREADPEAELLEDEPAAEPEDLEKLDSMLQED